MTCFFENGPERMFWIHEQLMPPLMSKTGKKKKRRERIKPSQQQSGSVAARIMCTTKNDGLILKAVLLEYSVPAVVEALLEKGLDRNKWSLSRNVVAT